MYQIGKILELFVGNQFIQVEVLEATAFFIKVGWINDRGNLVEYEGPLEVISNELRPTARQRSFMKRRYL